MKEKKEKDEDKKKQRKKKKKIKTKRDILCGITQTTDYSHKIRPHLTYS